MALTFLPAAQANAAVAAMFVPTTTYYGGLNTGSPGTTGANEAIADYTPRPAVVFGSASLGVESTTDAQTWTCVTGFTASYFSFWTASTAGTYLGGGALAASIVIPSGALVTAAIGALTAVVGG